MAFQHGRAPSRWDKTYLNILIERITNEFRSTGGNLSDVRDVVGHLLGGAAESELTIASGSVTPITAGHAIDTESDAASDDLDTIATTNMPDGRLLLIRAADAARTVVVKDAAGGDGQIHLADNADFSLDDTDKWLLLARRGADWYEVFRSFGADAAAARSFYGLETVSQAEAEAGVSTTTRAWTAERVAQAIAAQENVRRDFIAGLTLANNTTDSDHDIDFGVGECADSTNTAYLALTAALIKQIDATFAVGTDAGGMFTGSVTTDTWYHVFLIQRDSDGLIDAGFDTDPDAANIPSGFTAYRWLGAVKTDGSANILPFHFQASGRWFHHITPIEDYNSAADISLGTTIVLASVPAGFECEMRGAANASRPVSSTITFSINHPDFTVFTANVASVGSGQPGSSGGGSSNASGEISTLTNTSAQVDIKTNANPDSVAIEGRAWRRADV